MIAGLWRLRREDENCDTEVSLGYAVKSCLKRGWEGVEERQLSW